MTPLIDAEAYFFLEAEEGRKTPPWKDYRTVAVLGSLNRSCRVLFDCTPAQGMWQSVKIQFIIDDFTLPPEFTLIEGSKTTAIIRIPQHET